MKRKKVNGKLGKCEIFLISFGILLLIIVVTDLVLFTQSIKDTGVGMGFSRFWR